MEEMLIIAGFGGQGVQLIGKMLVEAGMEEGKEVSFLPSYGAEMRGGTSNCNVIISDEPVCSPIVNEATCVMALNRPSLDKFEGARQDAADQFLPRGPQGRAHGHRGHLRPRERHRKRAGQF